MDLGCLTISVQRTIGKVMYRAKESNTVISSLY